MEAKRDMAEKKSATTPARLVRCRVCGAENPLPAVPTRCRGERCPGVILPDGRSGVPESHVRGQLANAGAWLIILGVVNIVFRPLSTPFGVLLLGAGVLLLTVRTKRAYLLGALLALLAGVLNTLVALRLANIFCAILAAICFWAAISWFRSFRALEVTVDEPQA